MRQFLFFPRVMLGWLALSVSGGSALAGSHLWRFNEIFSNVDGTIQFIEMHEIGGSELEIALLDKWVESEATGARFVFPDILVAPTANKFLLLGTARFAALPGAPTPDYIIQENFFSTDGDTLRYWAYSFATAEYGPGDVPLDGVSSFDLAGGTAVNSPTNYAGESGSVDLNIPIPAMSAVGLAVFAVVLLIVGGVLISRRKSLAE